MAAQRKQVLTVDERESRAQAFFEGLTNPDRLADAMAGLTPQAWVNDVVANMEDSPADAADTNLYLGNIPVREWRHVRDNAPGLDWGSLTKQGHALDITKEYDLMYRIFKLKDGCGYVTIYPSTRTW